jgi:hypothetical protein
MCKGVLKTAKKCTLGCTIHEEEVNKKICGKCEHFLVHFLEGAPPQQQRSNMGSLKETVSHKLLTKFVKLSS